MADITETLWHALDGAGDPPESLRDDDHRAPELHFTAALTIDAAQGWAAAAADLATGQSRPNPTRHGEVGP